MEPSARVKTLISSMGTGVPLQFWSELPCNAEAQRQVLEHAANKCFVVDRVLNCLCFLDLLLRIPMAVILWKFVTNRCCTVSEVEKLFEVTFSEEEEDLADEDQSDGDHERPV